MNGRVTLCFFGDGASNEGTFHESLNIAASYELPVVFPVSYTHLDVYKRQI